MEIKLSPEYEAVKAKYQQDVNQFVNKLESQNKKISETESSLESINNRIEELKSNRSSETNSELQGLTLKRDRILKGLEEQRNTRNTHNIGQDNMDEVLKLMKL